MRQYIINGLVVLNIALMGWMLVDTLARLGTTKRNVEAVLSSSHEVFGNKDSIRKQSYKIIHGCVSKQIDLSPIGPVCLLQGVY